MRYYTATFNHSLKLIFTAVFACSLLLAFKKEPKENPENKRNYDIVIYGGSSAGIAAAIEGKRQGKTVVVIEPSNRIGGLTTNGLGQTDIGNKQAIGGIARDFYRGIKAYYNQEQNWKWQARNAYQDQGQSKTFEHEDAMWTFEPSAALSVFNKMIKKEGIEVIFNERLNRQSGVVKENNYIRSIEMESGKVYYGRTFIDATYEGDLMAAAKVNYHLGRESNRIYGETLNGVQPNTNARFYLLSNKLVPDRSKWHRFQVNVDPYIVEGEPSSGFLPSISTAPLQDIGTGDNKLQAYCFRMCLTDHPENRILFDKPANYKEEDFELLFRFYEAGENFIPWINSPMPNRKTDCNNGGPVSTDFVGQNYNYPEASYSERKRIFEAHLYYHKGLMWTLSNHERVPENVREVVSKWGLCKDEFTESNGWPEKLYIREARRMKGALVMTQKHCEGLEVVEDAVGLAAYTMDSHHVQRYINDKGHVRNEGLFEVSVPEPYPISYRSIIPKNEECGNLAVPVCLSASHVAFGSIRMEPVFMVLGQSAATACALSIETGKDLQNLDYSKLRRRLLESGQVLQ